MTEEEHGRVGRKFWKTCLHVFDEASTPRLPVPWKELLFFDEASSLKLLFPEGTFSSPLFISEAPVPSKELFFMDSSAFSLLVPHGIFSGLLGARPAGNPIEHNHTLAKLESPLISDPEIYRRLVGRLIYLSFTRPYLAYAVHILSQFMQQPRQDHWEAALRTVRYLKGCPGQGILLSSDCDLHITGWCDSDWDSCPLTRRSISGWLVFLGASPISWKTKKQDIVAKSSEAEFCSMSKTTDELKWLKALLLSLGVAHPRAMSLFCDSQSALYIARNPVFHERTKHIEVDCYYVRDAI
ncbi:uncharacterized protein LOC110723478 [Chenopodium quinoa]|uniref:uncharacterized protein LOC110723478 n=1 Tax=Chenopodium quinoa TaxID=63459 RepID=UPI000B796E2A|nr:uncharacterized protein LOC110723478 [Chenopodium quinoa]